ncbi:MAG: preprotein translocase subunit SecY, partial [Acidobacteria bacterium]|nr:preprotein translocase subunit SecY [Acidobacteriota bacterium]MDW7984839.1 preprotein translocase subunit SecY [Acidobacteriota bacterium]
MIEQLERLANVFRVPDLRRRVLFTLGFLAIYRLGAVVPIPGIDPKALEEFFQTQRGTIFGIIDLFTGGAFERMTIFALGIMPYITASIVLQLLTVVVPRLEQLVKEGELGRRKITEYTRYLTVLLSLIQSYGIALSVENIPGVVQHPGWGFRSLTLITLTAGTIFVMWLGEQITEKGIGNGISLIIFAGIAVDFPRSILRTVEGLRAGQISVLTLIPLLLLMVVVVAFIIWFEQAQRRIPIQYPKRVVGRRVYSSVATHLPLKLNPGGVIPIIFAISIVTFPQTLALFAPQSRFLQSVINALSFGEPLYTLLYAAGIVFFQYFYTAVIFNPAKVAEDIRK